ncbi:nonsense-mediated mRNA decay factor SMG8-like isoform X1 [Haliotis rufescens]|uniref:nonsense-mediated mRNA decay factor SMG8-like isoform X1 n=1 Tax=Haliotis rufescens TaxID=6454 RepID=UPI00201EEF7B|nr:nonsense-mediated mRNA decay factor SMG8-like isoform X1 [Haliotis rufescens]
MAAFLDIFSFPPNFDIHTLPNRDRKVCVVSIIGKSRLNGFATKASILNPILERDVFMGGDSYIGGQIDKGDIECFYDSDTQVVYLHHKSLGDTHTLVERCQKILNNKTGDIVALWEDEDFKYAKTILLLLNISHIVLLCHPGNTFDISYVKLFRSLDAVRMKLQTFMTETLQGLSISKDWLLGARPCSPRLLFYFDTPTFEMAPDDIDTGKPRALKNPPLKRLVHNIEDQIYRILRKSRIITNISNNSLFAVPANQEFVYVNSRPNEATDPITVFLQNLRINSAVAKDSESPRSRSYATNRRTNQASGDTLRTTVTMFSRPENSFKEFLWQHIDQAFTKGFDDNVGRNPVPAVFEMASSETWFAVAIRLYKFFFSDSPEGKVSTHLTTLRSLLETDVRFSENRCSKILPLAESAYQQDLPQHYITTYHLSKLAQAKRVFAQFARGPAFDKYMVQLEEACETWWKSGHQQCEAVSLTGNLCMNPLHRLLTEEETDANNVLPVSSHSSQLKSKAACNCGQTQADKDDPFDHMYANYEFYKALEETCCSKLEHMDFPVFKPSTSEVRAGQVTPVVAKAPHLKTGLRDSLKSEGTGSGLTNLSLALSLGQSGGSDLTYGHRSESSLNPENSQQADPGHQTETSEPEQVQQHPGHDTETAEPEQVHPATTELKISNSATRQHSTTEYLPGMIHSDSPSGLLPKFCSWSLCSLGPSSMYMHTQGLDLPGFLQGSNFLLPWDITVRTEKEKWPTVGETAGKKARQRRLPIKEVGEVTLRVFLGNEYECPRGHRFFCSGPEKIIKVSSTSTVKDNANKLLTMDMPLYCPCHCRSAKGYMAQLMRIFVVTPDGPIRVQLKPQIQPAPGSSPLFYPGNDESTTLPPGQIWVLRLPHVYLGDHGVYSMPSDPQQISLCHMKKGLFQYKEVSADG